MTALKGRAIKTFLEKRDPSVAAILLYGPDQGLVRERAAKLARFVVEDFKDPFNYLELTDADLKAEPSRIADEAAALSFTGGERAIRVSASGEASTKAASVFLNALDAGGVKPNGVVIVEGGDLRPASGLRKAFEKSKSGVALPCYADAPTDVRALAQELARAQGLRFEPDALELTMAILGEDHGLTRSELEKLMLYKGLEGQREGSAEITLGDVRASLAGGVADALDEAAAAAADGAVTRLSHALAKSNASGTNAVTLLRALQRQMTRLKTARGHVDSGESPAGAMKKLRPPVFFGEQRAFEARLSKWKSTRLQAAVRMLIDVEMAAKTTGAPQRELVERAALRIAMMAGR